MLCRLWALGAPLAGAMPARAEQRTLDQALILLAPGVDFNGITKAIDLIGGHVTHVFPPAALIVEVPSDMPFQAGILALYRQTVDEAILTALPGEARRAVRVWNTWLASEASIEALGDLDGLEAELVGDALVAPTPEEPEAQYDSPTPSFYQTSEFLIGRVAVSLMLPESDGSRDRSTEDWTESEQVQVLSEIATALDWWAANEPNANITFVYDDGTFARISTSVEPIDCPYSNQYLWIIELMTAKVYAGSSYPDQVRQHNNALREAYKIDWAFTIFVVGSSNDNDNRFSDDYCAYAYLGGPYAVMTYSNNGCVPQNLDAVAAHEIGHIFQALYQYYFASQLCTCSSGYLGVENQNSQYGDCASNVHSIMRGGIYPCSIGALDQDARGQIGWRDSDQDSIVDPMETKLSVLTADK